MIMGQVGFVLLTDYNETDYKITNSVILEITKKKKKMDILYSHLKP